MRTTLENICMCVEAADGTMDDIFKVVIMLKNPSDYERMNAVLTVKGVSIMLKLPGHGRYPHSPIEKRPLYDWPSGKRLAFYIGLNIEHFAFMAGIGNDPFNRTSGPQTQRNYAWRDYGLRVGVWRVFDMLDELNLPAARRRKSWRRRSHVSRRSAYVPTDAPQLRARDLTYARRSFRNGTTGAKHSLRTVCRERAASRKASADTVISPKFGERMTSAWGQWTKPLAR